MIASDIVLPFKIPKADVCVCVCVKFWQVTIGLFELFKGS